jgi:hypothetical protein
MSKLAAALAAFFALAAPASATTLHAHRVTAQGSWLGQADATTGAYAAVGYGAPSAVLRSDDGTSRTVAAPAGCGITAAGSGLLAGECGRPSFLPAAGGPVQLHLFVARLDGTPVARLEAVGRGDVAAGIAPSPPSGIGSQWISSPNGAKHNGSWTEAVNWRTGEVRESYSDDPAKVDDLDQAALGAPLCAPLKRVSRGEPDFDRFPIHFGVDVHGSWALLQESDTAFTLRHCGLPRPVALPKGFLPRALGDGWVAGFTKVAHRSPRLDVIRLADRRRFSVAGVPGTITRPTSATTLDLTRGRLYAFGATPGPIYTIKLPKG